MMNKRECEIEELVKSAYQHTVIELGLENVKPSFRLKFEELQKAHDAIHEFMLLAPLLFPSQTQADKEIGWHRKSAFFIYHWEVFHHAHRSLIEVLCGYYNVAFILLRATFELLIKGALWECLSHKEYRENSQILDKDSKGKKIKERLDDIFRLTPDVEEEFEITSAIIYDKISPIVEDPKFRVDIVTIIRQLDQWDMFNPVSDPDPVVSVYRGIYGKLSADVHVIPDRTDIGKRLLSEEDIFEQKVLPNILTEYQHCLHEVMDLAIVVELNIMRGLIQKYDEVKTNLRQRLGTLDQLGLKQSLLRAEELLKKK